MTSSWISAVVQSFPLYESGPASAVNTFFHRNLRHYEDPSVATMAAFHSLIDTLDAVDASSGGSVAALAPALAAAKFTAVRFAEAPDGIYCHSSNYNDVAINFFYRFGALKVPGDPSTYGNPTDPLVIQCPHDFTDGTNHIAAVFMQYTHCKMVFMNAIREDAAGKPTSAPSRSNAANAWGNMFNKACVYVLGKWPFMACMQQHGMVNSKMHLYIYNGFRNQFTTVHKSWPRLFCATLPTQFDEEDCYGVTVASMLDGKAFGKPLTLQNLRNQTIKTSTFKRHQGKCIQIECIAHYLNSGFNQLGKEDKGRYFGCEAGPWLLQHPARMQRYCTCINDAMTQWVNYVPAATLSEGGQGGEEGYAVDPEVPEDPDDAATETAEGTAEGTATA